MEYPAQQSFSGPVYSPQQLIELASCVPMACKKILLVGCGRGEIGYLLRKRAGVAVYGVEANATALATARTLLHGAWRSLAEVPRPEGVDAIVLLDGNLLKESRSGDRLQELRRFPGCHFLLCVDQNINRQNDLSEFGWVCFDAKNLLAEGSCVTWTALNFDPCSAALAHAKQGRHSAAYDLLCRIPQPVGLDAMIALEMARIRVLLDWAMTDLRQAPALFAKAQFHAFSVIADSSGYRPVYVVLSEFWALMGDIDIAARLQRIPLQQAGEITQAVQSNHAAVFHAPQIDFSTHGSNNTWPKRLLFVMHPRAHYGLDVLYDGLCNVLGEGHVVDFPRKPFLHGEIDASQSNYPCNLNRGGPNYSVEEVVTQLESCVFDAVLWSDCESAFFADFCRQIVNASKDTPIFVLDALDEAHNTRTAVAQRLGLNDVAGYFKREMLRCVDYGPRSYPMPFAYVESRIPRSLSDVRDLDFFWAGHRRYGIRRPYLERLEKWLGQSVDVRLTPQEYGQQLMRARVGINLAGAGFDTVRYWEIPAHGAMLLSEKLPIRILEDFRDGEDALFFGDLQEFEEALEFCVRNPDKTAEMAQRGRERFLTHHTSTARARQVLACMRDALDKA